MGAGVGRAGEVGRQQAVVVDAGLDEPDEAGAEHGRGGDDELAAQRLDGGEARLELGADRVGHGRARGRYALEEEVVVVRHGGVVEDGGLAGLAGREEADGLGVLVFEFGAWQEGDVSERGCGGQVWAGHLAGVGASTYRPSRH